jgi:hypothetical protein
MVDVSVQRAVPYVIHNPKRCTQTSASTRSYLRDQHEPLDLTAEGTQKGLERAKDVVGCGVRKRGEDADHAAVLGSSFACAEAATVRAQKDNSFWLRDHISRAAGGVEEATYRMGGAGAASAFGKGRGRENIEAGAGLQPTQKAKSGADLAGGRREGRCRV